IHRLPHGIGSGSAGAWASGDHGSGVRAAVEGNDILLPERAGCTAGPAAGGGDPVRGAGAVHRVSYRSNVLCIASSALIDRPAEDHEAGGWLARDARLCPVGDGAVGAE